MKSDVAGQAGPFEGADQRLGVEFRAAGVPVAVLQAVLELQEPDRDQVDEHHRRQADVQTPEGNSHRPLLARSCGTK